MLFAGAVDGPNDGVPAAIGSQLDAVTSTPTSATTSPTTSGATTTTTLTLSSEAVIDAATVTGHGYTPSGVSDFTKYTVVDGLHVIVATATGSGDGSSQQAFFFVGATWLGTDTSAPSGEIALVSRTPDSVTLSYALYAPADPQSSPSGGTQNVTYQLEEPGNKIVPLEAIPPLSVRR